MTSLSPEEIIPESMEANLTVSKVLAQAICELKTPLQSIYTTLGQEL